MTTAEQIKETLLKEKERIKNETIDAFYQEIEERLDQYKKEETVKLDAWAVDNIIRAAYEKMKGGKK